MVVVIYCYAATYTECCKKCHRLPVQTGHTPFQTYFTAQELRGLHDPRHWDYTMLLQKVAQGLGLDCRNFSLSPLEEEKIAELQPTAVGSGPSGSLVYLLC